MAGLADSLVSSSSRPLPLRMRSDLIVQRQTYLGREYAIVKDPLALKYYRFEEEEFSLLEMLDGCTSLDEMIGQFQRRYAPQKISLQELQQFTGMLYRSSLVVSDAPDQGRKLRERSDENGQRRRKEKLTNVLSIRFKGFDPDRLLTFLDRRFGWIFSPPAVITCLLLAATALLLVLVQFDIFCAKLPTFREFFAAKNWIWLGATLALTKIIHELGHGLTCKRFGGECHEMGVMLLVFTPCLYCNVSDSWMVRSKWRRAAIGAAGMYVEIVIASLATFLWWFTQPGIVNYLCLNVMFVSSVSTLLFNANPLLRYDGYYILSDLIEIPNLRQKATTILRRKMGAWFLGLPEAHDPFLPQRRQLLFAVYSVAAAAYSWVIALSIFWFLYHALEPYGLKIIGQAVACMALWGLLVQPLVQLGKFFYVPGRIDRMKKGRMLFTAAASLLLFAGILSIPLPHYVRCGVHIQSREADAAYVETAGELREIYVQVGQHVEKGQKLLLLSDIDSQLALQQLTGQRNTLARRLDSLRQRVFQDETAGEEIDQVEEALSAIEDRLRQRNNDLKRLTVRSPAAGIVLPPPRQENSSDPSGRLPGWSGTPLETKNVGAFLTDGVLVCQIGQPGRLEAILAIDQGQIEFVRSSQRVDLQLDQFPTKTLTSQIEHIAQVNMKVTPRSLSLKSGGALATTTDAAGYERPLNTTYQASSPLDDPQGLLLIGASGRAKIHVGYRTIGKRLWRSLSHTFHFDL